MSDQTDNGDRKSGTTGASGGKTLSLKRTVESGHVRQNFSHGRSKSVVVEKKRRRTIKAGAEAAEAPEAAKPVKEAAVKKPVAAKPAPKPVEPAAAPEDKSRSGVVLRTLTEDEKSARAQALSQARVRETEERAQAKQDAVRNKEEEAKRAEERKEADAREAEEAARLEAERLITDRAEKEAALRLDEEGRPTAKAPAAKAGLTPTEAEKRKRDEQARTPSRRGEARRRTGKLTINKAFDSEERQRSLASVRRRRERERKSHGPQEPQQKVRREVVIPEVITIQELANRMAERGVEIIKILMKQGMMVKITDVIDSDTAQLVAEELGHTVRRVAESDVEEGLISDDDRDEDKTPRAPVVTVMGHVDHGKTSLLDAMRKADVVSGEAGGITQHIGAYQVQMASGDKITFLDTPGHAAFTSMRARGAKVTDIVILVVAADDGVMPQTIEAINHAKAAEVPMIVAINKMDKPDADPTRVKNELLQHEVVLEDFGGDVLSVEVSATAGTGLDTLEGQIILQAELLDLRANAARAAEGAVVEAKIDRGRGPVGTMLVQRGTLKVGDILIAGAEWGKVRALINDRGENVQEAGPSVPVEVLGLNGVPEAGEPFAVVETEARAREVTEYRQRMQRDKRAIGAGRTTLDQMMSQIKAGEKKEVPLIIKADVQGSAEAIAQALEKLGTDEVAARVIHSAVGGITESDVTLATASAAPIIGFNVRAAPKARDAARAEGIEIRYYSIIYDLVDDVKAAMSGMLSPEMRETFLGNAEILEVFNISKVGKVAGCKITDGVVRRGASVRLIRDDVVIHEGKLSTLKRFKEEVKEVNNGQECGMAFENYQDMRAGDVIECFEVEEIARTLD